MHNGSDILKGQIMKGTILLEKHQIKNQSMWDYYMQKLGLAPGTDEVFLQLSPLDTNEKAEEVDGG